MKLTTFNRQVDSLPSVCQMVIAIRWQAPVHIKANYSVLSIKFACLLLHLHPIIIAIDRTLARCFATANYRQVIILKHKQELSSFQKQQQQYGPKCLPLRANSFLTPPLHRHHRCHLKFLFFRMISSQLLLFYWATTKRWSILFKSLSSNNSNKRFP